MRKHVGHKKRKGPRKIIKPAKTLDEAKDRPAARAAGTQYPTDLPRGKQIPEIYVKGQDGEYHKAHLRTRDKAAKVWYGKKEVHRYLYLAWREGDTVKNYYITRLRG